MMNPRSREPLTPAHPTRRTFLGRTAGALAAGALVPGWLRAEQPDPEKSAVDLMTPATTAAVERGLAWLAATQEEDGAFGSGGFSRNVAVCGLAGMAFLAGGSTPRRGPHGANVERSIEFILANTQESGFINVAAASSHGPMYGHGFATLFLAESYGMTPRGDVREKLAKAVGLIVNTQNSEGGWRYQPQKRDADISVSIAQIMALRAGATPGWLSPAIRSIAASTTSSAARTPTAVSCTCCKGVDKAPSLARRPALSRSTVPASTTVPKSAKG